MRHIILVLLIFIPCSRVFSAQWQWSVAVKSAKSNETQDHPRAFLWIPNDCRQVKGIVVGMHNMSEEGILEHDYFRKTLTDIGFAEIWITPGLDILFDERNKVQTAFDEVINSFASISGYAEMKYAPIVPIGHSAYATYPWNFAAWNPEKTLAVISVHGDAPLTNLTGCGLPNLDWISRATDGIPGLMVMGEYEWWEDRLTPAITYKNNHPQAPVSLLADAGHGHFDHSDMLVKYLALFIKKAAHYRLPQTMPMDKPVDLRGVSPRLGWLADRWHKDELPHSIAAPYDLYQGDRETAFWYFDKGMARETERYYAKARDKKQQYIGFRQDNKLLTFDSKSHIQIRGRFEPENDGLTFHLSAHFTDSLRSKITDIHSKNGTIEIDRINGPVQKINDTTFSVRFYRMGLNNPKRTGDIWLIAHHEGDRKYKSAVQPINVRIPYPYKEGKKQHITFSPIENVNRMQKTVTLNATSDSGLLVYYYVKEGPAEIENSKLILSKIPPRAKFPVKVTVVAWQYGRSTGDKIQTAEAVEQIFYIEK